MKILKDVHYKQKKNYPTWKFWDVSKKHWDTHWERARADRGINSGHHSMWGVGIQVQWGGHVRGHSKEMKQIRYRWWEPAYCHKRYWRKTVWNDPCGIWLELEELVRIHSFHYVWYWTNVCVYACISVNTHNPCCSLREPESNDDH